MKRIGKGIYKGCDTSGNVWFVKYNSDIKQWQASIASRRYEWITAPTKRDVLAAISRVTGEKND